MPTMSLQCLLLCRMQRAYLTDHILPPLNPWNYLSHLRCSIPGLKLISSTNPSSPIHIWHLSDCFFYGICVRRLSIFWSLSLLVVTVFFSFIRFVFLSFLPRDAVRSEAYMLRRGVRLSRSCTVGLLYRNSKQLNISSNFFSPFGSTNILIFAYEMYDYEEIPTASPKGGTLNAGEWIWQNRDFWPISRFISETIQDRAIVTVKRQ